MDVCVGGATTASTSYEPATPVAATTTVGEHGDQLRTDMDTDEDDPVFALISLLHISQPTLVSHSHSPFTFSNLLVLTIQMLN